ncbi:MAG: peptide chain release factor-like protein [Candidatus Omnitrophota bacterium]
MPQTLPGLLAKDKLLSEKMRSLGIKEEDIVEKFIRSSGPGGQNANKTSTCVYLKHLPTGIEVKCQSQRFQGENRYLARRILVKKIEEAFLKALAQKKSEAERNRRKQRRLSKSARLRVLEDKRRHSQKKAMRARVAKIED